MDLYNIITKIPYIIMLGIGLVIVFHINIGGLTNLSMHLDSGPQNEYSKMVVQENMMNMEFEDDEIESYDHSEVLNTRTYMPVDAFTSSGELEPSTKDNNCYFSRVPRLDGENYGFFVSEIYPHSYPDLECTVAVPDHRFVEVLAVDENGEKYPLRVHVYEVD